MKAVHFEGLWGSISCRKGSHYDPAPAGWLTTKKRKEVTCKACLKQGYLDDDDDDEVRPPIDDEPHWLKLVFGGRDGWTHCGLVRIPSDAREYSPGIYQIGDGEELYINVNHAPDEESSEVFWAKEQAKHLARGPVKPHIEAALKNGPLIKAEVYQVVKQAREGTARTVVYKMLKTKAFRELPDGKYSL